MYLQCFKLISCVKLASVHYFPIAVEAKRRIVRSKQSLGSLMWLGTDASESVSDKRPMGLERLLGHLPEKKKSHVATSYAAEVISPNLGTGRPK